MLAGNSRAAYRAQIMSVLEGKRVPQSKSGVHALEHRFTALSGVEGTCMADTQDKFIEWAKALVL